MPIMDLDQNHASTADSPQAVQRQVRVQLTTKNEDIALPDNTGPILVPTGKFKKKKKKKKEEQEKTGIKIIVAFEN